MGSFTKKDLIDRVADETGERRTLVKKITQEIFDQIAAELSRDNRIEVRDFGIFEVKHRAARTARNPKTLVPVDVPAKRVPSFRPSKKLQEYIDNAAARAESNGDTARQPETAVPSLRLAGTDPEHSLDHPARSTPARPAEVHVLTGTHQASQSDSAGIRR